MITSRHVTGEWVHVVDDGMVDEDALPDEARPTGSVVFEPVQPRVAEADGTAYTLTPVTALVVDGQLRDLQGREGVWLAAQVGITPVLWRASTDVEYQGEALTYPPVEFQLDDDMVLTARYGDDAEYPPPVVSAVSQLRDEAVAAAGRAESAAEDAVAAAGDAADQVAGAVEQDRVRAESAASEAAGSASGAAGSASAAAGSASAAEGHASDAGVSAGAAESAQGAAEGARDAAQEHRDDAATYRTEARQARDDAGEHRDQAVAEADRAKGEADRAQGYADDFGLTVTSSTGAPGSDAEVDVTGEGPAYWLDFTVPRGDQGEPGPPGEVSQAALDAAVASLVDGAPEALDTLSELAAALGHDPNFATTVSEAIGRRARIDGAPEEYDSLGKLVSALIAGDLGGSTDAGVLTGALTDQVDVSGAWLTATVQGQTFEMPVSELGDGLVEMSGIVYVLPPQIAALESGKADVGHSHTIGDVSGLQDALDNAGSNDAGDLTGALTDQVDASQAMVQNDQQIPMTLAMLATGMVNAVDDLDGKVSNEGGVTGIRRVTQSEYDGLTPDPNVLYIVEG